MKAAGECSSATLACGQANAIQRWTNEAGNGKLIAALKATVIEQASNKGQQRESKKPTVVI